MGTDCLWPLTPLQGIRIPASPTALRSHPGPAGRQTLSSRARTSRLPSQLSSGPLALLRPHALLTGQPGSPGPVPGSTLWTVLAAGTPYPPGSAALGPSQPPWGSPVEGGQGDPVAPPQLPEPRVQGSHSLPSSGVLSLGRGTPLPPMLGSLAGGEARPAARWLLLPWSTRSCWLCLSGPPAPLSISYQNLRSPRLLPPQALA